MPDGVLGMHFSCNIRRVLAATVLCAAAFLSGLAAAAETVSVPVRVGAHAEYTRIVFDFPKLTAYSASSQAGKLSLTFETAATPLLPKTRARGLKDMSLMQGAEGTQVVTLLYDAGARVKHYRLLKKIVVDIHLPGTEDPATPERTEPEPAAAPSTAGKVTEEKPEIAKEQEKQEKQEKQERKIVADATVPIPPKVPVPQVIVDTLPPQDNVASEEVNDAETPTRITLTSVEPASLAVFTRAGMLWIVTDSQSSGALAPVVEGPLAGVLGEAKPLKFEGGAAFRYILPPGRALHVEKSNLTWKISLLTRLKKAPVPATFSAEMNRTSREVKVLVDVKGAGNPLSFEDSAVGDTLHIVPAGYPSGTVVEGRRFPDLEVFPSYAGFVARAVRDGVRIQSLNDVVLLTAANGGLSATHGAAQGPAIVAAFPEADKVPDSRLFDFPNWRQGGLLRFGENRRALEAEVAAAPPEERSAAMMKLALLYFSNNFGHETLGLLRLIGEETPDMATSPSFIALRGAAEAMAGHYQEAIRDLSTPALQHHPEVKLWAGYAAAATEQWHMADRAFPKDNELLSEYPEEMSVPFTLYMAESALRLGHADAARQLLDTLDGMSDDIGARHQAALGYLKGETARQLGNADEALHLWRPVAAGLDRLYHAKASLARTLLELHEKKISSAEAVENIDSLRFAWRGDGLEVQIMHSLGLVRAQDGKYLDALRDMRAAARLSEEMMMDPARMQDDMRRIIADIFVGGTAGRIAPIEAITIYNEFSDMMPSGEDGLTAALRFADELISVDLLDQAAKILDEQLKSGLTGDKGTSIGAKLAAVRLLDGRPAEALSALENSAREGMTAAQTAERTLLRARALSQMNQTDAAIGALDGTAGANASRLRADIFWRAGRWEEAAQAMMTLVSDADPLSEESARLIVNAAVGYKLAGAVQKLQGLRDTYGARMEKAALAQAFGVVTRDGGSGDLADRDTVLKIAGEVDMFKGFLDSYKTLSGKGG